MCVYRETSDVYNHASNAKLILALTPQGKTGRAASLARQSAREIDQIERWGTWSIDDMLGEARALCSA